MGNEDAERYRRLYPKGTVIELDAPIDDPYTPKERGSQLVVDSVDDALQIHGAWKNGGSMAVIIGQDSFHVVRTGDCVPDPEKKGISGIAADMEYEVRLQPSPEYRLAEVKRRENGTACQYRMLASGSRAEMTEMRKKLDIDTAVLPPFASNGEGGMETLTPEDGALFLRGYYGIQ